MMTQEDKELLLKDLCARLPYHVKCQMKDDFIINDSQLYDCILSEKHIELFRNHKGFYIKPYLRPLSGMTEEEAKELLFIRIDSKYDKPCVNSIKLVEVSFQKKPPYKGSISVWFSFENKIHDICSNTKYLGRTNDITLAEIDWLNAHHFDYRGLIEKGLAVKVREENNPYKN